MLRHFLSVLQMPWASSFLVCCADGRVTLFDRMSNRTGNPAPGFFSAALLGASHLLIRCSLIDPIEAVVLDLQVVLGLIRHDCGRDFHDSVMDHSAFHRQHQNNTFCVSAEVLFRGVAGLCSQCSLLVRLIVFSAGDS